MGSNFFESGSYTGRVNEIKCEPVCEERCVAMLPHTHSSSSYCYIYDTICIDVCEETSVLIPAEIPIKHIKMDEDLTGWKSITTHVPGDVKDIYDEWYMHNFRNARELVLKDNQDFLLGVKILDKLISDEVLSSYIDVCVEESCEWNVVSNWSKYNDISEVLYGKKASDSEELSLFDVVIPFQYCLINDNDDCDRILHIRLFIGHDIEEFGTKLSLINEDRVSVPFTLNNLINDNYYLCIPDQDLDYSYTIDDNSISFKLYY